MWRLRTIIKTEALLSIGETENKTVKYKIYPINNRNTENGNTVPENFRYCDVFLKIETTDIDEAFAILYNETNNFLDRISMVSYGLALLQSIYSICPESVKNGQEFDIALPQFSTNRKTNQINLENLNYKSEISPEQQRWIRLIRNGLNSSSEEDKYINYYSLLEEIARFESEEYIITKCTNPKCLTEVNTGRIATNNFIKKLLNNHKIEKKQINKAAGLRNKIAHGGAIKDKNYLKDLRLIGSHLEEVCLLELEKRLPFEIINRLNAHIVDIPLVKHRCVCIGDSFDLVKTSQAIPARFVKLKTNDSTLNGQRVNIGIPLGEGGYPIIDGFSWPDIKNE